MKFCPKCHKDYGDEFEICSECMVDLQSTASNREVLLASYSYEEEALVVEGLLKSVGIHYIRRYDKFGDYLKVTTGTSRLGISIYVAEKDYDFAKELLESEPEFTEELFEDEYLEDDSSLLSDEPESQQETSDHAPVEVPTFSYFTLFFVIALIALLLLGKM